MNAQRINLGLVYIVAFLLLSGTSHSEESPAPDAKQTPEARLENVLAARNTLDRELRLDTNGLSAQELASIRTKISTEARQLVDMAEKFSGEFPMSPQVLEAQQQGMYGEVLTGMLHREQSVILGNYTDVISSCLFESDMGKQLAVSGDRLAEFQAAMESSFANAAAAAIRFRPESYNGVFQFVRRARTDAGGKLAQALLENPATDKVLRDCAQAVLNRKFSVGKTLLLNFTGVDGRKVDLAEMRGKVVLVDFWATSCAPCVGELPKIKKLYQTYHDKGFEILGISTDLEEGSVRKLIQKYDLPWPNQCDGKGLATKLAMECAVTAVPCYWLVDRNGIVREIDARSDLEKKIEFLVNELR